MKARKYGWHNTNEAVSKEMPGKHLVAKGKDKKRVNAFVSEDLGKGDERGESLIVAHLGF